MDQEAREFFHKVLEKVNPALTHDGRELIINEVINDLFDHPWNDDSLQSSMISNLARQHNFEIPEKYRDEDDGEFDDYDIGGEG